MNKIHGSYFSFKVSFTMSFPMLCGRDSAAQRQFIWRFLTSWWVMGALSRRQLPSRRIISRKKKRNSSSNYTQHRSVLQTDKACNYSAIPNKEPAFRLMSTLRWHLMWNASYKKDISYQRWVHLRTFSVTKFLLLEKNYVKRIQGLFVRCWRVEMRNGMEVLAIHLSA